MDIEEQRKKTKRYLTISSILHALLFLSFAVGSVLAPKPLLFLPTMQIDVVALPTLLKNANAPPPDISLPVRPNVPPPAAEEPKPDPEQMVKPEPKAAEPVVKHAPKPPVDEMALERKKEAEAKKRADAALKKMRDQLKQERLAEEQKKQAALDKRKSDLKAFEQKYRQAISGNQKNEGNALNGQMQATLNAYVGHITDKIRSNWALPSFLQSQNLNARIVIHIDARGNVVAMEFTRVSGNSLFDNYAEGAIRRSSPFFPPPAEMAPGLRNSGIEVKFPL